MLELSTFLVTKIATEILKQNNDWHDLGRLKSERYAHSAISLDNKSFIIGGYPGSFQTEVWDEIIQNETFHYQPELENNRYWPILSKVPFHYCTQNEIKPTFPPTTSSSSTSTSSILTTTAESYGQVF